MKKILLIVIGISLLILVALLIFSGLSEGNKKFDWIYLVLWGICGLSAVVYSKKYKYKDDEIREKAMKVREEMKQQRINDKLNKNS